jgi:hypothetical protein
MKKEIVKEVLSVDELSIDQIRSENREYNAKEWDKTIDRFSKYPNVKFYVARPQRGYDYSRYYATYETPEGINFLGEVSYSSCLSNTGFCVISIMTGTMYRILLSNTSGAIGYCANDKSNREIMARNSRVHGIIYSNLF